MGSMLIFSESLNTNLPAHVVSTFVVERYELFSIQSEHPEC
jgi:hypothetical protein